MSHRTLTIQPFAVECFSTKILKLKQYDLIIYDVSADFRILSGMWNIFVTSYPCSKFQHDMTLITEFILFLFCVFLTNGRSLSVMTSLSMTSFILCTFFMLKLTLSCSIIVQNFPVIGSLRTRLEGGQVPPPPTKTYKKIPVRLGIK